MELAGDNLVRYKCMSDGSKYVDHFSELVHGEDQRRVEEGADLFPEHLDDLQNTLRLGGVEVGEILQGLQRRQ